MDPASALGVAAAVVQFVDFSGRLLSKGSQYYQNGALVQHKDIVHAAASTTQLTNRLSISLNQLRSPNKNKITFEESALKKIVEECKVTGQELVTTLQQLEVRDHQKVWKSLRQALKSEWKKEKVQQTHQRLITLRESIVIHLLVIIYHRRTNDSDVLQIQLKELKSLMQSGTNTEKAILDAINNSSKQLNSAVTDLADRLKLQLQLQSDQEKSAAVQKWQDSNQMGLSEFVGGVSNQLRQRRFHQAAELVRSVLHFNQLHDRYSKIPNAHAETYQWIFHDNSPNSRYDSFKEWLETSGSSSSVYWITGKPGSGKSTLMRYIHDTSQTKSCLKPWQSEDKLILARAFFWNPGTAIQKSLTGLLRSLLYQLLSEAPELIQLVTPARWRSADLSTDYGLGMEDWKEPWSEAEMATALRNFVQHSRGSVKTLFLVDGLDEFDGNNAQRQDVVKLLKEISCVGTAKVCASSRPWLVFQDEFESSPQLRLEDLTRSDIQMYVADVLGNNQQFCAMQSQFQDECNELVAEISGKAQGVFLWVFLVVRAMLEDVRDGNDLCDLRGTLHSFPSDLEEYFKHVFTTLDDKYRPEAARLFRLVLYSRLEAREPITLITSSFSGERGVEFAIKMKPSPTSNAELEHRLERARRRLDSRCKGLLEATDSRDTLRKSERSFLARRVDFLHRTVKDFLLTKDMTAMINSYRAPGDDETLFLAYAILAQIKMMSPKDVLASNSQSELVTLVSQILSHTRDVERRLKTDSTSIVNELGHMLLLFKCSISEGFSTTHDMPVWWQDWKTWDNPILRLAIEFNLSKYAIKHITSSTIAFHQGRPLLDCALRQEHWHAPDFKMPPNPGVVKALLEQGARPTEMFKGVSIWAHLLRNIRTLALKYGTSSDRDRRAYEDWLACTEMLIQKGVGEISNIPSSKGTPTDLDSVAETLVTFFYPEDATRLKGVLVATQPPMQRTGDKASISLSRAKKWLLSKRISST